MPGHLPILRILSVIVLVDAALVAWASIAGSGANAVLPHLLPGQFAPGLAASGNQLFYAALVYVSALIVLGLGLFIVVRAATNTLLIGPERFGGLLSRIAGLSREDIAAAHYAVGEEQKEELLVLHHGRLTVLLGGALLLLGFATVCFTYAAANAAGAPLLLRSGAAIANSAVTPRIAGLFLAGQLANALLLEIPQLYHWSWNTLMPAEGWIKSFTLAFHVLAKLIVVAALFSLWRSWHLKAYILARGESEDRWADVREPVMAAGMGASIFDEPMTVSEARFAAAVPMTEQAPAAAEAPAVHVPPSLLAAEPPEQVLELREPAAETPPQPHVPVDIGNLPMQGGMQHTLH